MILNTYTYYTLKFLWYYPYQSYHVYWSYVFTWKFVQKTPKYVYAINIPIKNHIKPQKITYVYNFLPNYRGSKFKLSFLDSVYSKKKYYIKVIYKFMYSLVRAARNFGGSFYCLSHFMYSLERTARILEGVSIAYLTLCSPRSGTWAIFDGSS